MNEENFAAALWIVANEEGTYEFEGSIEECGLYVLLDNGIKKGLHIKNSIVKLTYSKPLTKEDIDVIKSATLDKFKKLYPHSIERVEWYLDFVKKQRDHLNKYQKKY